MARQKKSDSLVWGVILIVFGVIFLLEQFNIDVWDAVWRFWPVILIVWGANKLLSRAQGDGTSAPRRRPRTRAMKFREIFLVVVLVLAGVVLYQFKTGPLEPRRHQLGRRLSASFGQEFTDEETRTIDAPLPPAIEIVNGHGLGRGPRRRPGRSPS
ncbi:MAG: DUF5668 domain-containing protein [Candidatus Moduliflexus flocculans]|nr:DUF5668 domain-containing protein [Candidatus Moduliflexus flocculans]